MSSNRNRQDSDIDTPEAVGQRLNATLDQETPPPEEGRQLDAELQSRLNQTLDQLQSACLEESESQQDALTGELRQREALEAQRRQWQDEHAEARRRLQDEREELDAQWAELQSQRNAFAEECRRWELRQAAAPSAAGQGGQPADAIAEEEQAQEPAPQPCFQPVSEQAPVDLAEVLRRRGHAIDVDADQAEAENPVRRTCRPVDAAPHPPTAAAAASPQHAEEEESIESYVARFTQRILSSPGASRAVSPTPPAETPPNEPVEANAEDAVGPATPQIACTPETTVRGPRRPAPETHIDMLALRDLSRLSARNAIGQHAKQVLVRRVQSKLMVAAVGLLSGGGLWWMWTMSSLRAVPFYASLVALFAGIYWGVECVLLSGRLIAGGTAREG